MIIKLLYIPIKFTNILIKLYFIDNISIEDQQLMLNNFVSTLIQIFYLKILLLEIFYLNKTLVEILQIKVSLTKEFLTLSTIGTSLILVKHGHE